MAAALLPLLTLLLARGPRAALGHDSPQPLPPADFALRPGQYVSLVTRAVTREVLLPGPRFYMRDQQCLGYVPSARLCAEGQALGLEVAVWDRVAFPLVWVDDSLRNVSVARRPDAFGGCPGTALVETRLRCRHAVFAHAHARLPLQPDALARSP